MEIKLKKDPQPPKKLIKFRKSPGNPKYATAAELEKVVEEYFNVYLPESDRYPTISGLVLYLGFCDRASFYDMEKRPELSHTVKRARKMIIDAYEQRLHTTQPTGAIFALKNFGWKDTPIVDQSSHSVIQVINYGDKRADTPGADSGIRAAQMAP